MITVRVVRVVGVVGVVRVVGIGQLIALDLDLDGNWAGQSSSLPGLLLTMEWAIPLGQLPLPMLLHNPTR